jgi:PIN domain nuclease of toxin-antitoxin system
MAIKESLGKLRIPGDTSIEARLEADGFVPLSVNIAHAERVRTLKLMHTDPFDRLLIAQALVEGLTIVTADTHFAAYGVSVRAARAR